MPLQATSGAASYDAFGGGAVDGPVYIEDVFRAWLYTGNGSTQTITNGIDLAGKGGMVWGKWRSGDLGAADNWLQDTAQGASKWIISNATLAAQTTDVPLSSFNSNGFSLSSSGYGNGASPNIYASWTFRKQPKFFDVVTYTGNGVSGRTVAHNLGSVPGCIIVKRTDAGGTGWQVYHRSLPTNGSFGVFNLILNDTAAQADNGQFLTAPSDTTFTLGPFSSTNANGGTYVAYLFAHDAGGFGLSGTDNVVSCGSYAGNGSTTGPTVTLGYEPQWLLIKNITLGTQNWAIHDNMRGLNYSTGVELRPNTVDPEFVSTSRLIRPLSTGFQPGAADDAINATGSTYIYVAIRRGPMRTPTTGTSVLGLSARTGTGANATVTGGAGVTDLAIVKNRGVTTNWVWTPRLTGTGYMSSNATTAETAAGTTILQANPWDVMDGVKVGTTSNIINASGNTFINYLIDRAPGFMDVVCYTGTGVARTVAHNLTVAPELMIVKSRSSGLLDWIVYSAPTGNANALLLNTTDASFGGSAWNSTTPTASVFSTGATSGTNNSGATFVAYLFASCPGVSKVGSYTGNGSSQTINCGFTGGARFVMIKRTDSTGDWYVWDTARGIVSGNDPHLSLNTTAAEVTTNDTIDTDSTGFVVNQLAATNVNVTSATYIFLAIA